MRCTSTRGSAGQTAISCGAAQVSLFPRSLFTLSLAVCTGGHAGGGTQGVFHLAEVQILPGDGGGGNKTEGLKGETDGSSPSPSCLEV